MPLHPIFAHAQLQRVMGSVKLLPYPWNSGALVEFDYLEDGVNLPAKPDSW